MQLRNFLEIIFVLSLFASCSVLRRTSMKEQGQILSGVLVKKPYVDRRGIVREKEEYYLRGSAQDYYIKICEGSVTREELDDFYERSGMVKGISVLGEIREGEWDVCEEEVASRVGKYVVIYEILR